jgi:hypothetical protein
MKPPLRDMMEPAGAAHLASHGRAATHGHTGRVHTATVRTRAPTRESSTKRTKPSTTATEALLIWSKRSGDEDERSLRCGEDITWGSRREGDTDWLVPAEWRSVVRQTRVLLDRYVLEEDGCFHVRQGYPDKRVVRVYCCGEVARWRRLPRGRHGRCSCRLLRGIGDI